MEKKMLTKINTIVLFLGPTSSKAEIKVFKIMERERVNLEISRPVDGG